MSSLGRFEWVRDVKECPRTVWEGIKLIGTVEVPGSASSPIIMGWRDELINAGVNITGYTSDAVPWCGLFAALVVLRAGKRPVEAPLWALNWRLFGVPGSPPSLGDVLVFKRPTPTGVAGHVGFYIAEDATRYYVLGGNQSDAVSIAPQRKSNCVAVRSPAYTNRPHGATPRHITAAGTVVTKLD